MKLILVRHGETDRNKDKFLVHHGPISLNETGRQQAEAIAQRLQTEKIDIIYSSHLPRAIETAEDIAKFHPDVKRLVDRSFREQDAGIFAGRPVIERLAAEKASGLGFRDWKPEGGESLRDVKRRAAGCLEVLRSQHMNETVLVVSHGFFLFTFIEVAVEDGADTEKEEYSMSNCGLTILNIHPEGRVEVIHLNDTSHLGDIETLPSFIKGSIQSAKKT